MPSNYAYSPLTDFRKSQSGRARLWPACVVALLLLDAVVVLIFIFRRAPTSPLDNFQQLNNVPVAAVPSVSLSPTTSDDHAVVSSLYTDSYTNAIITLGHSLKAANVSARMIAIYIPDRISSRTLCLARAAGWTLHPVPFIPPPHAGHGLPAHFRDQYTKLNVWTLDTLGIKSAVYLDADTLVRNNFDELFRLPYNFAAVPDVFEDSRGFAIGFNAGVMLLRPNSSVHADMLAKLDTADFPLAWAEQAFLNVYFGAQVLRLPYTYNANIAIKLRSPTFWAALADDMRIAHYTLNKPFPAHGLGAQALDEFFQKRKQVKGGLWTAEVGWWEDAWREVAVDMQEPLARCA